MRFLFVSTHVDQTTGYSKVAFNILNQITGIKNVKLFHFGFQRHPNRSGMRKVPEGVIQYDAAANEDPKEDGFGFNKINEYIDTITPDVVMIYNDPLIIHKFIEAMKHERGTSPYKLWIYVDQVYEGIAQPLIDTINKHADRVYLFTEKWEAIYRKYEGECPETRILGHAVDSTMFSKLPSAARGTLRANLKIPEEAIVLLNMNRNSQRKRLDLHIMGFVELMKQNPDKPYYSLFVTNLNPKSGAYYDLNRIYGTELDRAGLDKEKYANRFMLIDTAPPNIVNDESINQLYNISDIGVNTSDGEGFGLCQLEHLYTGAPQIVTNVGSYETFLDKSVATFIPSHGRTYSSGGMPLGFFTPNFDVEDVVAAFKEAIDRLKESKKAAAEYKFPTWKEVCAGLRDDISSLANQ
jgi:hypothetical protein